MVAVAITMVLMSGVGMLFVGSMRAVRQGQQAMEAFDVARGAMQLLERDLTTCFTSREHGQYYSFFGMPEGMTFVGVAGTGSGDLNLSRVTYVLHKFDNPDGLEDATVWGRTFDTLDDPPESVVTRSLIRYVEPNISDLETYPYQWPDTGDGWWTSPLSEPGDPAYAVWSELRSAVVWAGSGCLLAAGQDADAQELGNELLKAKKRELWIRMLAGETGLPDIWALLAKDPGDYVVAEHIVWRDDLFLYGRSAKTPNGMTGRYDMTNEVSTSFNAEANVAGLAALDSSGPAAVWDDQELFDLVGDPLKPRLPEFVTVNVRLRLPSAYPGAPDFDRSFSVTLDIPSGFVRSAPPRAQ